MNLKVIIGAVVGVVAVVAIGIAVLVGSIDGIIKSAVEKYGSEMTKAPVALDGVSVSASSGSGALKGLSVGNPSGFTTKRALYLGEVALQIQPKTVTEKTVVLDKVSITSPEITYEIANNGSSNLTAIQKNVDSYVNAGKSATPPEKASDPKQAESAKKQEEEGKKFIIKELTINGAKMGVAASMMGGQQYDATLPTIRLTGIGEKSGGATAAEVADQVIDAITAAAATQVKSMNLDKLKEMGGGAIQNLQNKVGGAAPSGSSSGSSGGGMMDSLKGSMPSLPSMGK
jgi:hypothetical protein